jgi:putative ABC transport system permease protein
MLCILGGLLGCLATLPFNGISTGTANWATFSELTFSFRFGPKVLIQGVVMAMVMGLIGGLFPAVRAIRMKIIDALREA